MRNRWTRTRIDYHPCITSEPANQVCYLYIYFIDIFIITETKLNKSFPSAQFLLHGYSEPFRLDRNQFGGGLLVFIREDIPCSILNIKQLTIEVLFIEINLRKKTREYYNHW